MHLYKVIRHQVKPFDGDHSYGPSECAWEEYPHDANQRVDDGERDGTCVVCCCGCFTSRRLK